MPNKGFKVALGREIRLRLATTMLSRDTKFGRKDGHIATPEPDNLVVSKPKPSNILDQGR